MAKFRDGMLGPTVILFAICLVITFAMAGTYQATVSVIAQSEIDAANEVRQVVLPDAGTFTVIEKALPNGIEQAFKADNGQGYVFRSVAKGFGGPVTYYIGIDQSGNFVGISMFDHSETPGLGSKVSNAEYLEGYYGGAEIDGVDAITGATITSTSLKNALRQALEAYNLVKEGA